MKRTYDSFGNLLPLTEAEKMQHATETNTMFQLAHPDINLTDRRKYNIGPTDKTRVSNYKKNTNYSFPDLSNIGATGVAATGVNFPNNTNTTNANTNANIVTNSMPISKTNNGLNIPNLSGVGAGGVTGTGVNFPTNTNTKTKNGKSFGDKIIDNLNPVFVEDMKNLFHKNLTQKEKDAAEQVRGNASWYDNYYNVDRNTNYQRRLNDIPLYIRPKDQHIITPSLNASVNKKLADVNFIKAAYRRGEAPTNTNPITASNYTPNIKDNTVNNNTNVDTNSKNNTNNTKDNASTSKSNKLTWNKNKVYRGANDNYEYMQSDDDSIMTRKQGSNNWIKISKDNKSYNKVASNLAKGNYKQSDNKPMAESVNAPSTRTPTLSNNRLTNFAPEKNYAKMKINNRMKRNAAYDTDFKKQYDTRNDFQISVNKNGGTINDKYLSIFKKK